MAASAAPQQSEYEVKGAFLLSFTQYARWPEALQDVPPRLCVLGEDPFGEVLDALVDARGDTQELVLLRVASAEAARDCRIVFIKHDSAARLQRDLAVLADEPVLTVGEGEAFLRAGGIIAFRLEQERVRLSVNLGAARRAGLEISSRLLALAQVVE